MIVPTASAYKRQRQVTLILVTFAVTAIGLSSALAAPKLFLWNASASVPEGLYFVQTHARLRVGDLAVTRLPADIETLAAARNYLPRSVVLIKPVTALAGMKVCRMGTDISLGGRKIGTALRQDSRHRPMPVWTGCRDLSARDVFLMNPSIGESFDGRYFGPTPVSLVQGRAIPLLIFNTHSGKAQPR